MVKERLPRLAARGILSIRITVYLTQRGPAYSVRRGGQEDHEWFSDSALEWRDKAYSSGDSQPDELQVSGTGD